LAQVANPVKRLGGLATCAEKVSHPLVEVWLTSRSDSVHSFASRSASILRPVDSCRRTALNSFSGSHSSGFISIMLLQFVRLGKIQVDSVNLIGTQITRKKRRTIRRYAGPISGYQGLVSVQVFQIINQLGTGTTNSDPSKGRMLRENVVIIEVLRIGRPIDEPYAILGQPIGPLPCVEVIDQRLL